MAIVNNRTWWIDDFQFYDLLNSTSVTSGQFDGDNERLCGIVLSFKVVKISAAGIKQGTTGLTGFNQLSYLGS